MGLYRDNGKENGKYYIIMGYCFLVWGLFRVLGYTVFRGFGLRA